jgi:plasmid stability protein
MEQDLCIQFAKIRNILRQSLEGRRTAEETLWALDCLHEIAVSCKDGGLMCEHGRWCCQIQARHPGLLAAAPSADRAA